MKQTIDAAPMAVAVSEMLEKLGIKEINAAYSTGLVWGGQNNKEIRKIYSPADGNLIASASSDKTVCLWRKQY